MKNEYNFNYIRQKPEEVLSRSINCERWASLNQETKALFTESECVNNSYEKLYDKVVSYSREESDFLWSEFLAIAYALRHYTLTASNPLIIKEKHRLYVLTNDATAFSISEKRLLKDDEHRSLKLNEFTTHYSLENFIKEFYEEIAELHRSKKDFKTLKKAQSFIIEFDPRDVEWLARRGITNKDLHCYTEALKDLKKYVLFTDGKNCPSLVRSALMELQGLKALETLRSANSKH